MVNFVQRSSGKMCPKCDGDVGEDMMFVECKKTFWWPKYVAKPVAGGKGLAASPRFVCLRIHCYFFMPSPVSTALAEASCSTWPFVRFLNLETDTTELYWRSMRR